MRKDRLKGLYAISFHLYAVPGPAKPTGAIELRIEYLWRRGSGRGGRQKGSFWGVAYGKYPHFDLGGVTYVHMQNFIHLYT